ncbi:MAG: hypothetical protein HYU28_03280 [Actinobacteria bacterium]|nr:hypothetical protein [Actinomycetota bacterium]
MNPEVVAALEGFIERGEMWNRPAMERLVDFLESETERTGDRLPLMIAKVFAAVLLRMGMAPIDKHLAYDVEAHVYQRLYKVLEAVYDDLPDSEVRTRIEVFHRRLSRMIVDEDPRPVR